MDAKRILDYVLENGSVNQKYIILRDVCNEDIHSSKMTSLQEEVVKSRPVRKILKSQNEDGWFGIELHGCPGKAMDSSATYLRELGVEPYNDFMRKARQAVIDEKIPYRHEKHNSEGFDRGYSYSRAVALAAFQEGGTEIPKLLENSYSRIMEIFENSLSVDGVDQISKECTDKKHLGMRAFLKDCYLPWISDFNVLVQNDAWRTSYTQNIADEALQNIGRIMPITITLEPYKGRYLGTIGNYILLNGENPFELQPGYINDWISIMTNICRITDVSTIAWFNRQIDYVRELMQEDKLADGSAIRAIADSCGINLTDSNREQLITEVYYKFGMLLYYADIKHSSAFSK